jgi:tetratricopeptide (TPR) repeat protein
VLRDCSRAIGLNPRSAKAYYRCAAALVALERYEEAIDCCNWCLAFDEGNGAVLAVKERAEKCQTEKAKKLKEKSERAQKEKQEKILLDAALKACYEQSSINGHLAD